MRRFLTFVTLALAVCVQADHNRTIPGAKMTASPKIDGVLDPAEWAGAAKSSGFVHIATGEKTPFDATIHIGYDAENLYLAFDCPDPEPKLIRSTEYRRNASVDGDDHVILLINPFGTHQQNDNNEFSVGAGGGMSAEFAGGRSAKREWEGAWDSKSRITDRGWECEIVIPWKILRLPGAGVRDIEINFARVIPRAQLGLAWCDLGPQERMEYNGVWKAVDVPKIKQAGEILALPYQIVGYDDERKQEVINTGLDLRYSVNSQITSLATINPDFQNVEGAVLNLSFSRFERLAQERRPFFVEGQSEFRLGGMSASMFAPQRLGAFDLGVKAFGKLGDRQSFGALMTTQFDHETAAVARYRQTWGNRSYLNTGVVNWNDPDNGIENTAYSTELVHFIGNWGGDIIYGATDDNLVGNGERVDFDLMFQDQSTFIGIGTQRISENFRPRIGFAPRTGFEGHSINMFHSREAPTGPFSEMNFNASYFDSDKEDGSGVFLRSFDANASFVTRRALEVELFYEGSNFKGDLAQIYGASLAYPENDPYRNIGIGFATGTVDDERYSLIGVNGNYRFPNRITLSPSLQFENEGGSHNTLHIIGLSYELDAHRSIAGRVVVRDEQANWYLAYRHSGNIGAEWYVILGDPNADTFQKKLIVKAVIPFTLRL